MNNYIVSQTNIANSVTTVNETTNIIQSVNEKTTTIVTSSTQGPPGIQGPIGPSNSSITVSYTAGTTLSGGLGVILANSTAIAASSTNLTHAGKLVGILTGSVLVGALAPIQISGELEGFFGLTINSKVYLQPNGTISSNLPTSGLYNKLVLL